MISRTHNESCLPTDAQGSAKPSPKLIGQPN